MTSAPVKWRSTSDHNVTETAFDAIKCKLSAVTLGYFHDPFLQYFVEKPTRRIPLIHRGYYLRHVAITRCIELFLSQYQTSSRINIVSLGAGFDTLFFRLVEQQQWTGHISVVEVDSHAVVQAKTKLLQDERVRANLFPKDRHHLSVSDTSDDQVAWQGHGSCASYSLIACDLGAIPRLETTFKAAGVDRSLPTLILAECVLSYLDPEKGTRLLQWLAETFARGSIAVYDPIALQGSNDVSSEKIDQHLTRASTAFSSTLQRYFAVKGCTLRGATGFRTAADHARRFLALASWQNCRILDMNSVFAACTSAEEKRRVASLEPFDEYVDWVLSNAHYAMYLADNRKSQTTNEYEWTSQFVPRAQHHRYLLSGSCVPDVGLIRTFQHEDLAAVRLLFERTHLEFATDSRAVREFVATRLRGPHGDMFDVHQAFQTPTSAGILTSNFWVAEVDGKVVGCVGVKPHQSRKEDVRTAELCRLSVSSAFRRRGVASALVRVAEAFTRTCGAFDMIRLDTLGAMEGAQQLYRSLGHIEQKQREKQQSSFKLVSTVVLMISNSADFAEQQLARKAQSSALSTSILTTNTKVKLFTSARDSVALEHRYVKSLVQSNGITLDLSSLGLTELPPLEDLSRTFPHLRHLNIRRNLLCSLPEGLAQAFPELVVLNASENSLEYVSEASIGALRTLQRLDIAHNRIRELPIATFNTLDLFEELNARGNLIERITFDNDTDDVPIAGLSNLQVLVLADNRLKTIAWTTPESMPKLRVVDLSGNPDLTEVPEKLRRLHERNLILHSRAKRRELITRALSVRRAVAQALASAPAGWHKG